jgi:hypothetical protein
VAQPEKRPPSYSISNRAVTAGCRGRVAGTLSG